MSEAVKKVAGSLGPALIGPEQFATTFAIAAGAYLGNRAKHDLWPVPEQYQINQTFEIGGAFDDVLIVGKTVVSGTVVKYKKVTHEDDNKEYHHMFITLCGHRCEAVEAYQIDGKSISTLTGPGYYMEPRLGDQTSALPRAVTEMGIDSSFIGYDVTDVYCEFLLDPEIFPNGIQDLKWLVTGAVFYDPRKDSTVGGVGSHRIDDESTWEWSDNAALINFYWKLFRGAVPLPIEMFDMANIAAAANVCDELVDYKDADNVTRQEKRYTCNGVVQLTTGHEAAEQSLLTSCGGAWIESAGKFELRVATYQGPAELVIDQQDCIEPPTRQPHTPLSDRFNKVLATIISKDHYYQSTDMTPIVSEYLRDNRDDGATFETDLQFGFTDKNTMAQRLSVIALNENAAGDTIELKLWNLKGWRCRAGSVVELNMPDWLITGEYEVLNTSPDFGTGGVSVTVKETSASIYTQNTTPAQLDLTPNTIIDNTFVEQVTDITFNTTSSDSFRQGVITWDHPVPNAVRRYNLLITKNPADSWFLSAKPYSLEYDVTNLPAGSYIAAISAENRFQRSSVASTLVFNVGLPSTPTTSLTVNVLPGRVHIVGPTLPNSVATYQWRYRFTDDVASSIQLANGNAVTVTETPQDGTLYLWYRIAEGDLVDANWIKITIPNLIGLDSTVVTPEFIAGLTLPGLPLDMLNTISGISQDLSGANVLLSQSNYNYDLLIANLIGVDAQNAAHKLDILRIDNLVGDKSTYAQITEFAQVRIGYEDINGDWIEGALFARAFNEIKLVNADEEELSVYSFFQALETKTGELAGRIDFVIDVDGRLTGVYVAGSETESSIKLAAENFYLVAPNGDILQDWDTVNQTTRNYGTFYAKNMIGDTAAGATSYLAAHQFNHTVDGSEIDIMEIDISAQDFVRDVIFPTPWFSTTASGFSLLRIRFYVKSFEGDPWTQVAVTNVSGSGLFSSAPTSFQLAAGDRRFYKMTCEPVSGSVVDLDIQLYVCSIYRYSTQAVFTHPQPI